MVQVKAKYGANLGLAPFLEKARVDGPRLKGGQSKRWRAHEIDQSGVYL